MAGSVNKVILVGNLGRDPEIRSTNDGTRIANLNLATSESWRDRVSGERKERTEWHRVVIFNENLAKIAEQYLKKGAKVYLEGQLQTRKYTDKDGVEKYSTEIVADRMQLLGGRQGGGTGGDAELAGATSGGGASRREPAASTAGGGKSGGSAKKNTEDFDDDIPF